VADRAQQPEHGEREQASPEVCKRVQDSFDRQGLMSHLGARIARIEPGRVPIVLPTRRCPTRAHGRPRSRANVVAATGDREPGADTLSAA
jgi:hypothetical protein